MECPLFLGQYKNIAGSDDIIGGSLHHLGLLHALSFKEVAGVIIGPSNIEQLKDSFSVYENFSRIEIGPYLAKINAIKNLYEN